MDIYYEIELDSGAKYKACGEDTLNLKVGDFCVIRKDFYTDYGKIARIYASLEEAQEKKNTDNGNEVPGGRSIPTLSGMDPAKQEIPCIQRKATMLDQSKANENTMRAKSALRTTLTYVEKLQLPMKLINAHYAFDNKLITIQFSAEGRVDFRELVKLLSAEFNTRIELRQIGVRDETSIIGGISPCGRPLCCCVFLKDFASINVKMAKEQDLALTPSSISGICGRLKCCLKYEHEGYLELERGMPRRGDTCEIKEGRGRIVDRNLLTQKVTVQLEDSSRTVICPKEEVTVVYPEKYKVGNDKRDERRNRRQDREKNSDGDKKALK